MRRCVVRGHAHPAAKADSVNDADRQQPLRPEPSSSRWRTAGGAAVGLAVLLAKFKTALFALLNLKWLLLGSKFLISGLSFVASIWFYALFFGWKFGIVFVLLIAIHEAGHILFMRAVGLPAACHNRAEFPGGAERPLQPVRRGHLLRHEPRRLRHGPARREPDAQR